MKRNPHLNYNRLPMEGVFNCRDLGGYATANGSVTRYHQFVRSENLNGATKADLQFLLDYGVRSSIDLRGVPETETVPNPLRDIDCVDYINLPFITDNVLDMRKVKDEGFKPAEFYVNLVKYQEMVYKLCHFILDHLDGAVHFHCVAGKDRTGVLAMILLGLCGVDRADIVAHYEVTYTYLLDNVTIHFPDGLEELEYSKPEWIMAAYDYIITTYGSVYDYLIDCGLKKSELKKIMKKMIY